MRAYTIGDAIDIAVQQRHAKRHNSEGDEQNANSKVMSRVKRSTKRTHGERGQENEGTEIARVETPGLLIKQENINTRRSICLQKLESETH